jgi:hypothetical protein
MQEHCWRTFVWLTLRTSIPLQDIGAPVVEKAPTAVIAHGESAAIPLPFFNSGVFSRR